MSAFRWCVLLTFAMWMGAARPAAADGPTPADPKEPGDPTAVTKAEVRELKQQISDLQRQVNFLHEKSKTPKLAPKPAADEGEATGGDVLPPPKSPADPATQADLKAVADIVTEHAIRLGKIARRVDGTYVPNVARAIADSPSFRTEMQNVVHGSMKTTGMLRIRNWMSTPQAVRVNGYLFRVEAMQSLELRVPTGTVTTELVGYEAPKHLSITPPAYEQELIIAPQEARYSVYRPVDDYAARAPALPAAPPPAAPVAVPLYVTETPPAPPCGCH
jgi:hypothetical protein